ncbi:hypothetical protein Hanom_Chr03g00194761 [Helianthus anomalus]
MIVKQELHFMSKLSRMSVMVNPREMMTVPNTTVVRIKMFQVQARMDPKVQRGRLLIQMQVGYCLRENLVR